ncbi:hypothetical protein MLD38_017339 [Melastoma candidum]|uniref:Uncharacterized protein n=1 Tax=Melastoma candidum TaxID=119954 RepID=A0ACB9QTU4_9MYRT|nr:hypothetical protein MLD38_017339 [Melastoma candidum]
MGLPGDDLVLIQKPKKAGEPYVITVNCPDKTGLGCDICRIILDFGLSITKGGEFQCSASGQLVIVAWPSFFSLVCSAGAATLLQDILDVAVGLEIEGAILGIGIR